MEHAPQHCFSRRWLVGSILILVGLILFLMNAGIIARFAIWKFFPLLLIAGGISRMLEPHRRAEGFWFLALGVWLQVSLLRLGGLTFSDTWPVVLVAFGVYLIWRSAEREQARRHADEQAAASSAQSPNNA